MQSGLYLLWDSRLGATILWALDRNGIIWYSQEYLLSLQYRYSLTYETGLLSDPWIPVKQGQNQQGKLTRKQGRKGGVRQRLKRLAGKGVSPPLPSIMLANVRLLHSKLDELQAN